MSKRFYWCLLLACFCLGDILNSRPAEAVAFEKYIMVFPLYPADDSSRKQAWFGEAFRTAWSIAALNLRTLIFLKDDELAALQREYRLSGGEPEPGQMETIADDKDIALLYGSYRLMKDDQIKIDCYLIPGRNFDVKTFKVSGNRNQLSALYAQTVKQTIGMLDLTANDREYKVMEKIPGTSIWEAFRLFHEAQKNLKNQAGDVQPVITMLDKALQVDRNFIPALGLKVSCALLRIKQPASKEGKRQLNALRSELARAAKKDSEDPYYQNAQIEWYVFNQQLTDARTLGEENLRLHPTNYKNYLMLGEIYRGLSLPEEAEKILIRGLEQQGTGFQKKPFQLDLGLLLLKRKDQEAEIYLQEVLKQEPKNAKLLFLRASALYRLGRFLDVISLVQQAEAIETWPALLQLKAKTAFNLGNIFLKEGKVDQAYSYASIAMNLQSNTFETAFLMAKVMRKKGFSKEAFQQLEAAKQLIRPGHAKDHMWLGTEYVALGYKDEGAKQYTAYLKKNPKAPERERLVNTIRELKNDDN